MFSLKYYILFNIINKGDKCELFVTNNISFTSFVMLILIHINDYSSKPLNKSNFYISHYRHQ